MTTERRSGGLTMTPPPTTLGDLSASPAPELNGKAEHLTPEERALEREPLMLERLKQRGRKLRETKKKLEVYQDGELLVEFYIRPLTESVYYAKREQATRYMPRRRGDIMPSIQSFDMALFRSLVIYEATVKEDREKLWDNHEMLEAYEAVSAPDLIDKMLMAGGKEQAMMAIDDLSGFSLDVEEDIKNSSGQEA